MFISPFEYSFIKLSCSLYLCSTALVWMCVAKCIHRSFKLSMVLRLKCILQLN
jgi:hypothetical protein